MSVWGVAIAAVGVAVSGATLGVNASNQKKASSNAFLAQQADANERARQESEAQGNEMAGIAASMINPANAGGDPAIQQYLAQMGYIQPGAEAGQPASPPDPSTPRQQTLA